LASNQASLDTLKQRSPEAITAKDLQEFEALEARTYDVWHTVEHLNAVMNSEPLMEAYNTALNDRCNGYGESVPIKLVDSSNDPATIPTRAAAGLQANPDIDAVLSVGPHVCAGVQQAIDELGMSVHHSCFDLSPPVMDMINAGKVKYTIDQQQRLQGYMPIIVLHLYNNGAGLLPGANIPSGPGFVDKSNASSVAALAGVDR